MKVNCTLYACKQYPIIERYWYIAVGIIMTTWSQCHTVYVVSLIWIKMAQTVIDI